MHRDNKQGVELSRAARAERRDASFPLGKGSKTVNSRTARGLVPPVVS